MRSLRLVPSVLALAAIGAGAFALTGAGEARIEVVDFGKAITATEPAYDARIAPASDARIKEFIIPITHDTIEISKGVKYEGWTFGGTVPGAYMVHCGTPPVTMHIMQGMYFAIIVDPESGWGTKADKEFVLVQSEFYAKTDSVTGAIVPDWNAAMSKQATQVVFNGRSFQYKDNPLLVDVGDRVRFFVVNAGPTFRSDFHVVGAVFDRVYPDGNPENGLERVQTQSIPAGGGAVFETTFEEGASGEGLYPFVTHSFADAEKGAVGIIKVGEPRKFAHLDH